MSEREFVVLDKLDKYDDVRLAEVIGALESEAQDALAELRAELQQRTMAALERAAKAGVVLSSKPPTAGGDGPKKRGPKPKSERVEADETASSKLSVEQSSPLEISGRA
jgi:hypothetical protein